ncbi:translation initiation factor IF-2 [Calycomorphotria hydatis]|uniref:Translation initiation factor IF-2 n=1 Tax=Calycomorphotria hydatis TaxID=2528027 RepID=A0A517TCU0_9PLAN|nr:translation initiation factor IF-2 [Calycomorphotria hydatis]QDT66185.1 Translation initiation factor IF-2 [Calycomorphotria hydatis]
MKIRIFALAKELGLDSKELIEHANAAGVMVKNSALASISPEEKDLILEQLEKAGSGESTPEAVDMGMAPVEPPADRMGKVRKLDKAAQQKVDLAEEPEPVADEPEPVLEETEQQEETPLVEVAAEATEEPVAEASEDAGEEAPAEVTAEDQTEEESESSGDEGDLKPEEYIPPPTAKSSASIREMRPVGTIRTNVQPAKREREKDKERKRPQLARPNVAAPPKLNVAKPKPVAKDEPAAQKPEMPLTPEMLDARGGASPLQDMIARRGAGEKKPGRKSTMNRDEAAAKEELQKQSRRTRKGRRRNMEDGDDAPVRRQSIRSSRRRRPGSIEYSSEAVIELPITVRSLSEATGRPANQLMGVLMKQGLMLRINDPLTEDQAMEIAIELGIELEIKRERDLEEELADLLSDEYDEGAELITRPPIVTILGHVDHGKTTMVDKLRKANVAGGEAGGITQHIAAYQIDQDGQKVTFVDTPGHAAFGEMRARGANVTDVIVLVVAADDGVMPQTEECISHAKAAGVPLVVALNKIDLPGVDEQKTLQQLAGHDLLPAEWGGDTEVVRTSGETGQGLDDLIDTIQITSELLELKANADRPAVGVCLEAFRDEGRGVLAWFIVQKGTLRIGDVVLCGGSYGRVRAMYDDYDREMEEAPPACPVMIAGLNEVPNAGSHFFCLEDIEDAREAAERRSESGRAELLSQMVKLPVSIEDYMNAARFGEVRDLPLILKADSPGSIEALRTEIMKFEHPEVRLQLIHAAVGGVNESDVSLASASGAIIVAFHVIAEDRAEQQADRAGVEIRRYRVIYELIDDIRMALEGLLAPEKSEVQTGRALVLQTFKISRTGTIAGCRVLSGTIERNNKVHVIRQQKMLNTFDIASLKREKDDAKEVREGMECGIRLEGFNDVKEGDILEAFRIEETKRTLEDAVTAV